jgi:hypothetical protein
MSIAWFPAGEWPEARRRWTDLQEQELPEDHAAYSKVIESSIRRLSRDVGRNLLVAPIMVDALEGYSRLHGLDPNTAEARAQFAAELTRLVRRSTGRPGAMSSVGAGLDSSTSAAVRQLRTIGCEIARSERVRANQLGTTSAAGLLPMTQSRATWTLLESSLRAA